MLIEVRIFAGLRERAGTGRLSVEVGEKATVAELLEALGQTPVGPVGSRACVVAVNREYAEPSVVLSAGDEVALVPPISGGSSPVRLVRITSEPIDVERASRAVTDPAAGAVVVFTGVTRDVPSLEYEVYEEMASERIRTIAEEEAARLGLCAVAVEHRTGTVPLSEPSVVVAVSSGHREEAFAGARAVIDRLKSEAPIWKQEITEQGSERVEGTLPVCCA